MNGRYLQYLIPLEVPAPEEAAAARASAEAKAPPRLVAEPSRNEEPSQRPAVAARATAPPAIVARQDEVPGAAELEARLGQLAELVHKLERQAQAAPASDGQAAMLRRSLAAVEERLDRLESQVEAAGTGPRLPLGAALLVPLFGMGLSAAFHFGLYELFLHAGDPGGRLAGLAAETLLGFHIATEAAPHVYFYWTAVEALFSSFVIVVSIGLVLRRLRRRRSGQRR
jgi:hypothetical protein